MVKFSETEKRILELFNKSENFTYNDKEYIILKAGKPRPNKGECKTDVYILAQDKAGQEKEFKISIKQNNADFLENKITLERAKQILGEDAPSIIEKQISTIKKEFEKEPLICFSKYRRTEAFSLKMGWRFEFINKTNGEKSGLMSLSEEQKIDIYTGRNLSPEKKDSKIDNIPIRDSGVANYIINLDSNINDYEDINYYTRLMFPIEDFAKKQNIYFVCKALNYRCNKDRKRKWEGNRSLAVYVVWKLDNDILSGELVFDNPLSVEGNDIGENISAILSRLKINKNNFCELKGILHKNTPFYNQDF